MHRAADSPVTRTKKTHRNLRQQAFNNVTNKSLSLSTVDPVMVIVPLVFV